MEPPHIYVHEAASSVVHHQDYLNPGSDRSLCGSAVDELAPLDPAVRPAAVCPDCEARLPEYHLTWWRVTAETATAELDELRIRYRELAESVDQQARPVAAMQDPAPVLREEGSAGVTSDAREATSTSTSILDRARKELLEVCRNFDEAVPYWRVKNSTDAFSDKLKSDERLLLAHEVSADGSFIRWCIREIETHGWQVTNSPVHGEADDMLEAWTHDLQQPKKTKRRLGWSRS